MSLAANMQDLAIRAATEAKSLRTLINGNTGDLTGLQTAAKSNLVAALNELKAAIDAAGSTVIDDAAASRSSAYSSSKTVEVINASVAALVDSSPAALDTLNELAAALGNDPNFATSVNATLADRVRIDADQLLTEAQQAQARANIKAMGPSDIQQLMMAMQSGFNAVGDTNTDFVALFEAGL